MDRTSLSSISDSPQITETDDLFKFDLIEDNSRTRSGKTVDTSHIEVINTPVSNTFKLRYRKLILSIFQVNFSDTTANFTVKIYFALQFREIRTLIFPAGEDDFVRSLSRCVQWAAHGGKSGSSFCKTKGK